VTTLALVDVDWPAISPPRCCCPSNVFDYIRINTRVGRFFLRCVRAIAPSLSG